MPTISVSKKKLFALLDKQYSDEEFDELCFQFGLEVDEAVDDPEKGTVYKIEVAANRYDLLCIEGISRALNIYLGKASLPTYQLLDPVDPTMNKIIVCPDTKKIRPYIVGAILRNINLTPERFDSFIDLQDKLHQNLCRKRTLVAIGTHDLDTVEGPFTYDALCPKDIIFAPLNRTDPVRSDILLQQLSSDPYLKEYVPIIQDSPVYPVIKDRNGIVLSLPPVINGNHSKMSPETRNIFIESTATDKYKAQLCLDTLVCMFSEYCDKPFSVELVDVIYPDGINETYPSLEQRSIEVSASRCNVLSGVNEDINSVANLLTLMSLNAEIIDDDKIKVHIPPTRYDILHECDVAEDFAIAYGYDRLAIDRSLPPTNTIGQEFHLNYLSDKLRLLLSQNNYVEAATFTLLSKHDMGTKMRVDLDDESYVKVGNPKTVDFEAVRISLLPGILKTVASNKHISLPIRLFEISDIVLKSDAIDLTKGIGAYNQRTLCALNYNVRPGIEKVQGLLDNIMIALKVPFSEDNADAGYYFEEKEHPSFFPGHCARIIVKGAEVGVIGILHPEVILSFNLNNPATALELNLEKLLSVTLQ